ncbi:MAG TPA: Maf family protein [Pirellulales bacterium]|nr:Maf family protein [Pirellulales bacterium]
MNSAGQLILASGSPRRRDLLAEAGYDFRVVPPSDAAEDAGRVGETAAELVARLARQKAADVAQRLTSGLVLGCDTVVECTGQILGKPRDAAHASDMLSLLSGQEQYVYSGLCLWPLPEGLPRVEVERTTLRMRRLSAAEIGDYLASGLWLGKAGGFGYQDRLGWLEIVEGSESNIVGLPLERLAAMLRDR